MAQELINAAAFQGGMDASFQAELDASSESLSDGIGGSYGIIKYKGKQWSLVYRGEQFYFRGADGYGSPFIDVIILQQARIKSKSYFPNYEEGSTEAPLCASIDGVVPDVGVPQKQAEACALCPRNVWKNSPDGKKVRECQDYKRIAVLLLPNVSAGLLGQPLLEPVFLRIPGASLQGLALMGDELLKKGVHFSSAVVRIDFDPTMAYPKMRFMAIQKLGPKEAPVVLGLRKDPLALRIIGEGEQRPQLAAPVATAPAPQQQRVETGLTGVIDVPASANTPPANQTPPPRPQAPPPPATQVAPPPPAPAPAQQAIPPQAPSPPTPAPAPASPVDTGFGGVTQTTPPAPPPQAAPATTPAQTSDTGQATDADAALDARIAALMPS